MAKIVCVTGGSSSARVRLRINGTLHPNSERRASLSNVNLTIDDWPLFTHGYATALPAGVPILVELLGVGVTVGASTASLNNWSMLFVKWCDPRLHRRQSAASTAAGVTAPAP
ncbi:hypothetical protein [Nannocystis pusilla]|uniref:hypothetical protein n=1 Tax=Nannocystis pusilla TaxID=889268 RepID=UPI003B7CF6CC